MCQDVCGSLTRVSVCVASFTRCITTDYHMSLYYTEYYTLCGTCGCALSRSRPRACRLCRAPACVRAARACGGRAAHLRPAVHLRSAYRSRPYTALYLCLQSGPVACRLWVEGAVCCAARGTYLIRVSSLVLCVCSLGSGCGATTALTPRGASPARQQQRSSIVCSNWDESDTEGASVGAACAQPGEPARPTQNSTRAQPPEPYRGRPAHARAEITGLLDD